MEINCTRSIYTPIGNTIVIDGTKKLKILYTQNTDSGKANFLDMELPYKTFIELPNRGLKYVDAMIDRYLLFS